MDPYNGDCDGNGICFAYDVLLNIFRRLPGGAIAACQCVCRAWRDIIRTQGLSLELYFPRRAFSGIFVTKVGCYARSAFFAPPADRGQRQADPGNFRRPVFQHDWAEVHHSCNGLLLLKDWEDYYVCNPATVRCSRLPQPSMPSTRRAGAMFLAFDPAVSLHYEVFFFQEEVPPTVPEPRTWVDLEETYITRLFGEEQYCEQAEQDSSIDMERETDDKTETKDQFGSPGESSSGMFVGGSLSASSEHDKVPPLRQLQVEGAGEPKEKVVPFTMYSSRTEQWENREFTPGRCAQEHLYDAVITSPGRYEETVWSSEYWRGSLYMHCRYSVLMILRPSVRTYNMVELPGEPCGAKGVYSLPTNSVLASYEIGIHYVTIKELQLKVWMLAESTDGQLGWSLSHDASLNPHVHMTNPLAIEPRVTWRVDESSDKLVSLFQDDTTKKEEDEEGKDDDDEDKIEELRSIMGPEYSWDSDEDNFIDVAGSTPRHSPPMRRWCEIMGFHSHKRALVLLLNNTVVVYHVDSSRMQYLGDYHMLIQDNVQQASCVDASFPYRPCYADVLPTRKPSLDLRIALGR